MVDAKFGMSYENSPPYSVPSWRVKHKRYTLGRGEVENKNIIVMGRNTYNAILASNNGEQVEHRGRETVVISSTYQKCPNITFKDMTSCLTSIAATSSLRELAHPPEIWVTGGCKLIKNCLRDYMSYIDRIVICKMKTESVQCDIFFPINALKDIDYFIDKREMDVRYEVRVYNPKVHHQEHKYLNILKEVLVSPQTVIDDSKYNVLQDVKLSYDFKKIDKGYQMPFITTRTCNPLESLRGCLEDIQNTTFHMDSIGFRLRSTQIFSGLKDYETESSLPFETRQFEQDPLERMIRHYAGHTGPFQHIIRMFRGDSFDVEFIKFDVPSSSAYINLSVYLTRVDVLNVLPEYIEYFTYLMIIIAKMFIVTSLGKLTFMIGDCLLDIKDVVRANSQLKYHPRPPCKLELVHSIDRLSDLRPGGNGIKLIDYDCWNVFPSRQNGSR